MNYIYIILLVSIAAGLAFMSYRIYKQYVDREQAAYIENNEFKRQDKREKDKLLFFYADWCPHSQKSMKVWESVQTDANFQASNVDFITINGEDSTMKGMLREYNVKEFPSIVLKMEDKKIIFDANLTSESLMKFLTSFYFS